MSALYAMQRRKRVYNSMSNGREEPKAQWERKVSEMKHVMKTLSILLAWATLATGALAEVSVTVHANPYMYLFDVKDLSTARSWTTFGTPITGMIALEPNGVAFTAGNHLYTAAYGTLTMQQSGDLGGAATKLVQMANGEIVVRAASWFYAYNPSDLSAPTHVSDAFGDTVNDMIALRDGGIALTAGNYLYIYKEDLQTATREYSGDLGGTAYQLVQLGNGEIVLKAAAWLYSFDPTDSPSPIVYTHYANFGSVVNGMTALSDGGVALTAGNYLYRFAADLQSSTYTGDLGGSAGQPVQMTNGEVVTKASIWFYTYDPTNLGGGSTHTRTFTSAVYDMEALESGGFAFTAGNYLYRCPADLSNLFVSGDLGGGTTHLESTVADGSIIFLY